jgi:sulfofructose kinase
LDVLCVGHASWDISFFLDGYPAENGKCEVRTMLEYGGGPAANAAFLLTRWGVHCGIAAAIGTDDYGNRIADEFFAAGTDITLLEKSPEHVTPVSVILVNERNGSRTIVNRRAAHGENALTLPSAPTVGKPPRVLLFDGHELEASLKAMEWFPDARTILDAGSLRKGTQELANRVDYLVASERFACQLSGVPDLDSPQNESQAMAALYACNGHPVAITRGERGLLYGDKTNINRVPAFTVQAVDTTAAGDIFHGAFAFGVLKDMPIDQTLRLASAAAALSVVARGGRPSIPSLFNVQQMLCHVE